MTGRRLDDGSYFLESDGKTIPFKLLDEVIIHRRNRMRIIKGTIEGVSGNNENVVTTLQVRDLRHEMDLKIPVKSICSMEVL